MLYSILAHIYAISHSHTLAYTHSRSCTHTYSVSVHPSFNSPDDFHGYQLNHFCIPTHYENDLEQVMIPNGASTYCPFCFLVYLLFSVFFLVVVVFWGRGVVFPFNLDQGTHMTSPSTTNNQSTYTFSFTIHYPLQVLSSSLSSTQIRTYTYAHAHLVPMFWQPNLQKKMIFFFQRAKVVGNNTSNMLGIVATSLQI